MFFWQGCQFGKDGRVGLGWSLYPLSLIYMVFHSAPLLLCDRKLVSVEVLIFGLICPALISLLAFAEL
jgi:hypothetical protein